MLTLQDVTVRFGQVTALDRVSLTVNGGEIVCLLGPSGSGKSTLLRVVAGVDRPTGGRVVIDGVEVAGTGAFIEPERRRIGMVFQDYALFPHLTVAANVQFGLKRKSSAEVRSLLSRLGLDKLADSYPHQLSGGERQRVALARAMAPKPRLLLMDEPFSSLDSRLRDDVRRLTLDFVRESGTTTVIVTHDPDEAMRTGDRIALLEAGRLVQFGTPETLYLHPSTLFAARFFSDVSPLIGACRQGRLETRLGSFAAPGLETGSDAIACLRPQHFRVAAQPTGIEGRIVSAEFCGETRRLVVQVDGFENPVAISASRRAFNGNGDLHPGAAIHLEIDADEAPIVSVQPHSLNGAASSLNKE